MQDFKERTALYLRKSRMDPDSESVDETLARHMDTLMKFAARYEMHITGIYKEVVSGDGLFTRPEMVRLLQDIEHGEYTSVLCMEIDRLGRSSQKDSGIIFETFKERDVFIVTPVKTYNLSDDIDELSVEMQSFIARQELKSIKRRLRKGVEKSCELGYHISEPPYGYRRVYTDKHPTLEICDDEAAVIKIVYDMYVNQGMGCQSIADRLNGMGYHPRGNDHFSRSTIRFFLSNPIYTGKIIWNRQRHTNPKFLGDKHRITPNAEDKWIVADGIHAPIISSEQFDEAQQIRLTRSHPSSNNGVLKNQFAGLVYCANCGKAIQRQFSKTGGNRLLCPTAGCNRSVKAEYVEQYILYILRLALNKCRADFTSYGNADSQATAIRDTVAELEKNKKTTLAQKSNLHDLLEKGVYDTATFTERNDLLTERLKKIDAAILKQKNRLNVIRNTPDIAVAAPFIGELTDNYNELSAAEKNALLKKLFSRIDYLHAKNQKNNEFSLNIQWKYL